MNERLGRAAADPAPSLAISCGSCLAFDPDPGDEGRGLCRRHAPVFVPDAAWPAVAADTDWCLQHRQAVEPYNLTFVPSDLPVDGSADG